jgi:flagellar biosynthesis protein FlhF
MNLRTFTAATMIECLALVKREMGAHAVILHTRTYRVRIWCGLRKREMVEITAGIGMNGPERRRQVKAAVAAPARPAPAAPQISAYIDTPAAAQAMKLPVAQPAASVATVLAAAPAHVCDRPGQQLLHSPAAREIIGIQVAKDVEELKKLVSGLVDTMHRKDAPQVPEDLFDYYLKLIENQVATELASDIVCNLRRTLRPEHLQNASFVNDKIAEQIEKLIPTCGPIVRTKATGPHVVALIGPTGVGKTTTIAKLAANLKLREKRRVGLITIDTYRIAAIDQLERYAQILGSKLRVVASPEDLRQAVRSFGDVEFILIDTAGRSPRDTMKINELKTFLDAATPDEIHLVLSSTASQGCVELAMERFGEVHFDRVIFTKLDEAAHVGVVLNAMKKLGKSLSYVTTGQDVPDDIEVGQGRKLARRILGENTLGGGEGT